jgi:hypothetical protein
MPNAEKASSRRKIAEPARLRASGRAGRLDALVASTLLLLLIFGWAVPLAAPEQWARGRPAATSGARHP